MSDLGFNNLSADKLVNLRIHRIDAAFVKELREAGYNNLTADELVRLRINGIDGNYIKRMKGTQ